MNANELADNLNDWRPRTSPAGFKLLDDAATMLRHQQAEIDRLNKLAEAISRDCNNTALERNELHTKIKALKIKKVSK